MAADLHSPQPTGADRDVGSQEVLGYDVGSQEVLGYDVGPGVAPGPRLMEWRGFHTELQRAAAAAIQTGAPLSLLMVELPGPDRIDRGIGPAPPAQAVDPLTDLIQAAVGACGSIARYSEQRLAIIMTGTDAHGALERAERIGRNLSSRFVPPARAARLEAPPTIGIAQFQDDEPLGHLIQRAADALDQGRTGRTPIVVAERRIKARSGRAGLACRLALALRPSPIDARREGSAA
jgi:GGDEF domain-containing protein